MPKTDEARSSNTAVMNEAMPATHNSWMAWPKALVRPPPRKRVAMRRHSGRLGSGWTR